MPDVFIVKNLHASPQSTESFPISISQPLKLMPTSPLIASIFLLFMSISSIKHCDKSDGVRSRCRKFPTNCLLGIPPEMINNNQIKRYRSPVHQNIRTAMSQTFASIAFAIAAIERISFKVRLPNVGSYGSRYQVGIVLGAISNQMGEP